MYVIPRNLKHKITQSKHATFYILCPCMYRQCKTTNFHMSNHFFFNIKNFIFENLIFFFSNFVPFYFKLYCNTIFEPTTLNILQYNAIPCNTIPQPTCKPHCNTIPCIAIQTLTKKTKSQNNLGSSPNRFAHFFFHYFFSSFISSNGKHLKKMHTCFFFYTL